MPKKALSERVKAQKQSCLKEETIWKAVDVYHQEQTLGTHQWKGAQRIAQDFGIEKQWTTIINRYRGGQSTKEAHEA